MQTTKQPYELLVRWGQDGVLLGAHIQYRIVTSDDGVVLGEFITNAAPLSLDVSGSFPLADILTQVQADALTALNSAMAERDAALVRVTALEAQLSAQQANNEV